MQSKLLKTPLWIIVMIGKKVLCISILIIYSLTLSTSR